jgi:FkbM family methyltransferase
MQHQATIEFQTNGTLVRFHLPMPQDHIQRLILHSNAFYEQSMLEDIGPRLPEGGLVLDIGANIGNHTVFFAKVLGAKVLCFEPNPAVQAILKANVDLNNLGDRVEVHNIALGAEAGTGRVENENPSNLGMAKVVRSDGGVRIARLDDIIKNEHVDLVKIDVEGMESDVLRGATATLHRCRPLLLIECGTLESLTSVEAQLRPLGYRKIKVYNDTPTYLFATSPSRLAGAPNSALRLIEPRHLAALPKTREIVAGMATVAGNEVALKATVMSLLPQIDRLFVYLNGFKSAPKFLLAHPKISHFIDEDGRKYGDAGKMWGLDQVSDAVYITCDDDIIYPEDFVSRMVTELALLGGKGAVGIHGSLILQPTENYYKQGSRAVFHFEQPLMRRRRVHVVGTAACAFHTSIIRIKQSDFRHPNMADIWLAEYMQKNRLPAYVAPHNRGWLVPLEVTRPTIWAQSAASTGSAYDSSARQNEILSGMYPISLLRAASPPDELEIHVIDVNGTEELAPFLTALSLRTRETVLLVVCRQPTDGLRRIALNPALQAEVHLLSFGEPLNSAYGELLHAVRDKAILWTFRNGTHTLIGRCNDWPNWFNGLLSAPA